MIKIKKWAIKPTSVHNSKLIKLRIKQIDLMYNFIVCKEL